MPQQTSLWRESAIWRWLFAGALFFSALAAIGNPWRSKATQYKDQVSEFDPVKIAKPTRKETATSPSQNSVAASDAELMQNGMNISAPVETTVGSVAKVPPVRSTVVWSNTAGSVSGGGLIAAYCCTGASSTVMANKSVSTGKHYWELTLSVSPGHDHPDTWTNAGVTAQETPALQSVQVRSSIPTNGVADSSSASVIKWGQKQNFKNGDVFMFALDADSGNLYFGVNGRWLNGEPGGQGGASLKRGVSGFSPFVTVSASSNKSSPEGDRWIANFGGARFKYALPSAFGAYGAQMAAVPAVQTIGTKRDASGSPMNRVYENEFVLDGQVIPLPPGKWVGLAFFRGQGGSARGDSAVLGKVVNNEVVGLVAVNARSATYAGSGYPVFDACDRTDYVHIVRDANEASGLQRCWWINHATQIWEQPIFRAARTALDERGVAIPEVLMNVGFRRASATGFATTFYYSNPYEVGIRSQVLPWSQSEWHKSRISDDQKRAEYVNGLKAWGNSWAPVFYALGNK